MSELFSRAVALEEKDPQTALNLYEQIIQDEDHAAAYINAGTIYYNERNFAKAESYYKMAIKIDPNYALAYFDLANVMDETGRLFKAVEMYREAIRLAPGYADAHYNLAISYDRMEEPRKALIHWRAYLRSDQNSPWADHARGKIKIILREDPLKVVWRNPGTPKKAKRRGKMALVS